MKLIKQLYEKRGVLRWSEVHKAVELDLYYQLQMMVEDFAQ